MEVSHLTSLMYIQLMHILWLKYQYNDHSLDQLIYSSNGIGNEYLATGRRIFSFEKPRRQNA